MKCFWLKSANGSARGPIVECTPERFKEMLNNGGGSTKRKLVMADSQGMIIYNTGLEGALTWDEIEEIKGMMEEYRMGSRELEVMARMFRQYAEKREPSLREAGSDIFYKEEN